MESLQPDRFIYRKDGSKIPVDVVLDYAKKFPDVDIVLKCSQKDVTGETPNRKYGNVSIFDESSQVNLASSQGYLGLYDNLKDTMTLFVCDIDAYRGEKYDLKGGLLHEFGHRQDVDKGGFKAKDKPALDKLEKDLLVEEKKIISTFDTRYGIKMNNISDRLYFMKQIPEAEYQQIIEKYDGIKSKRETLAVKNKLLFKQKRYSSTKEFTEAYDKDIHHQAKRELDVKKNTDLAYFLMEVNGKSELYAELVRYLSTGKSRLPDKMIEEYFPNVCSLMKKGNKHKID